MINIKRFSVLASMMLICSFGLNAGTASAQSTSKYPDRSIRLVIPYPPGGPTDLTARVVAAEMGKTIGQSVVVDNRAGASGMIGSEAVARAEPNGYTILGNASM